MEGMAAGKVPKTLPTTLSHLKILELNDICFGEPNEVSIVLCLIRSSPNLAKIKIEACTRETTAIDPVLELLVLLEMQDGWGVYLNQLREVEMRNLSGIRSELDLIKLLLAKSPMLERMLIEPNSEVVLDKGLRILKKLTRFQRLSPQAQITYYDPDEDSEDEV
ncbi:F-box/FBD/LRR-repeat protein At1g13570-like isoform X2 [Camellia sinensis]|uniref:F-box/FBD/LRR-repeat protein At1g13570-like isoform X2 n=1 Tax=Camellia sinensis TaxID=4442 RepID=UPI0010363C5B|nr:F-box/FBD/LRR-repeat protein At1g13570-like isoform X2 [Camellia sinensis]